MKKSIYYEKGIQLFYDLSLYDNYGLIMWKNWRNCEPISKKSWRRPIGVWADALFGLRPCWTFRKKGSSVFYLDFYTGFTPNRSLRRLNLLFLHASFFVIISILSSNFRSKGLPVIYPLIFHIGCLKDGGQKPFDHMRLRRKTGIHSIIHQFIHIQIEFRRML